MQDTLPCLQFQKFPQTKFCLIAINLKLENLFASDFVQIKTVIGIDLISWALRDQCPYIFDFMTVFDYQYFKIGFLSVCMCVCVGI